MAELAGLSVAANVAQFVVLGMKAANYLYTAYNDTEDFKSERGSIRSMIEAVQLIVQELQKRPPLNTKATDPLVKILNRADDIADDLLKKLRKLEEYAKRDAWYSRATFAARSLFSKPDIEMLLKRLDSLGQHVSHHLVFLSERSITTVMGDVRDLGGEIEAGHKLLQAQLAGLHQKLDRANQDTNYATSAELSEALKTMVYAVEAMIKDSQVIHRTEIILQGLKFEDIVNRQSQVLEAHHETFRWALSEKASLDSWLRGDHGVYWIQGKAGSGKSTLMKYLESEKEHVMELLRDWAGDCTILLASHYFWAIGTPLQRNIEGLLRTLLFRIFVQSPFLLKDVCSERLQSYHYLEPWTFEELRKCFVRLSKISSLPTKFCFLIDGLDEYRGEHGELVKLIKEISTSSNIKLCVSSRPWPQFAEVFGNTPWKLSVHDFTRNDIHRYVVDNLGANCRYVELEARNPQQAALLTQEITQVADGVFLWVYYAIRDLLRGLTKFDSLSDLVARLKGMPKNLEDYFERMLDSIDEEDYYETSVVLVMVAAAGLPVTTLHTWAARESRRTEDATCSLLFRDLDVARKALSQKEEASRGCISEQHLSDYGYHSRDEKKRLVSRCKDLIYVSDEALQSGPEAFSVGLLHRTVGEFILSQKTRKIIEARLGATDASLGLYGRRELARGYYRALTYDVYEDSERSLAFCQGLQLSDEIYAASPDPEVGLFYLGLPWLVACLHLGTLSYDRSSPSYIGTILDRLHLFENEPKNVKLVDNKLSWTDLEEKPLVRPFNRFDLLVSTMLDRWPGILDDGANHVNHASFSEAGEVHRMLWLLTCKRCWPAMIKHQEGLLSITHILFIYLRQRRTQLLMSMGGEWSVTLFEHLCAREMVVSNSHSLNKMVIGTILDALGATDGVDPGYHFSWFWSCFVSALAILDYSIQEMPVVPEQLMTKSQFPSNLDEISRIMLASKTPQYLPVLPHQNARVLFESRAPGSTRKMLVPPKDWGHSEFGKVNVAKVLKDIAGVSIMDHEFQGTAVDAETHKESDGIVTSVVSGIRAAKKYFL